MFYRIYFHNVSLSYSWPHTFLFAFANTEGTTNLRRIVQPCLPYTTDSSGAKKMHLWQVPKGQTVDFNQLC